MLTRNVKGAIRSIFVFSEEPVRTSAKKCVSLAGVAQLAEQLTCNQQVAGSSPIASSI
jgi:hypothetical protein